MGAFLGARALEATSAVGQVPFSWKESTQRAGLAQLEPTGMDLERRALLVLRGRMSPMRGQLSVLPVDLGCTTVREGKHP